MEASPLSRNSWETASRMVRYPASADKYAIVRPAGPAPITPIVLISMVTAEEPRSFSDRVEWNNLDSFYTVARLKAATTGSRR